MDFDLTGRTILVAGSSRGIGFSIAAEALAEGAKVAVVARSRSDIDDVCRRFADKYGADRVWAGAGDMRETDVIEDIIQGAEANLGPLWGVVANVGLGETPFGLEMSDDAWRAGMSQNLDSAYRLARGTLRRMIPRQNGTFVFISSIAGASALGMPLNYASAKAGLNHLAKELARLTGDAGVRVNAVAPGNVIFPGGGWEQQMAGEDGDKWQEWIKREVPLGRLGTPEEISAAVLFLLSPRSSFVHGSVMVVDGGQTR